MAAPKGHVEMMSTNTECKICSIEATVVTGFEEIAREEASEKLGESKKSGKGKIVVKLPVNKSKNFPTLTKKRTERKRRQHIPSSSSSDIASDCSISPPQSEAGSHISFLHRHIVHEWEDEFGRSIWYNGYVDAVIFGSDGDDSAVYEILNLCSVDNCRVLMSHVTDFGFNENELECMQKLREFVKEVDWDIGIQVWHEFYTFEHPISSLPQSTPANVGEAEIMSRENRPKKKRRKEVRSRQIVYEKNNISNQQDSECNGCGQVNSESHVDSKIQVRALQNDVDVASQTDAETAKKVNENNNCENINKSAFVENGLSQVGEKIKRTTFDPSKPSFRVTCNRVGDNHCFDSMCAAANFGGAVNEYFGWNVNLTKFDFEVLLNILDQEVSVCFALTKDSLHRRNITSFGPTTLRPTIAHNMLRLCCIQPGDVVCDPMCGSGSIPIEAAMSWRQSIHVCGEIHNRAVERTQKNIESFNENNLSKCHQNIEVDTVRWNVCHLPLKGNSVDVFITDLPFGKRKAQESSVQKNRYGKENVRLIHGYNGNTLIETSMSHFCIGVGGVAKFLLGRKEDNWTLYAGALENMARVCKLDSGRVCLLTSDKKAITKAMHTFTRYWIKQRNIAVNIGGLSATVYLLARTGTPFTKINREKVEDKCSIETGN